MRATHPCRKRYLLTGLLLSLCVLNGSDAESSCKKGCPQSDDGILHYKPGHMYEYNFDSIMTVGLKSGDYSDSDDTSLKMMGTAKVFAQGNCGYTLQLSAIKVTTTKESVEKKLMQAIQKPVHFTMVGGKVEPELCADAGDNAYSLNVKRAVISMLQSNTEATHEVDVFGQCSTHTAVSNHGAAQIVTKVRDLNNCAYREKINNGIINGITNEKSGVKSSMLSQADYSKESKVHNGVVETVQLVEDYRFTEVVKAGHNVRAKVVTNMKLKNAAGTPAAAPGSGNGGHPVSIIFQKPEVHTVKNIAALKSALTDLVHLTSDYVKTDSAQGFVELIRLMRNADTETLLELAAVPHPNKVLARKVYLDALFRVGTAESAKAIMKQLNKMDDKEKFVAIVSLNLVQTVDRDTLNQAASLFTPNAPKEVYLAAGSIVAKYCERNGCDRGEIDPISKKFTDSLKHCKANTKKDEERIVYVLKGIGNTHNLASSVAATLAECSAPGHSNRIRVAALQSFPAASCEAALQTKAMELLRDGNEDSELRIEAYLAAISCPSAQMANDIDDILRSEKVHQVRGFIASNLRAIRDSTDATREHQRYYLGNIRLPKNVPRDLRRYSYNNELSYKLDPLGVSASADYKLIYSQHGFLPRSARLNVSTEVFGTNYNVLEASVRQENIERILEYYIGPKGLLNKDFDEIMSVIGSGAGAGAGGRARRSIADDTAKFSKKYKTYASKNVDDLNLDLSLKLFGSEMMFLSLGDNIPSTLDDVIRTFSGAFDEFKKQVSSFSKDFMMHTLFLDVEYMYPTGLGIPLELSAQGFAANHLNFAISIDVDAILESNWQRANYRLKIVPSVDVTANVQLGFDAYVLATGIRVAMGAHSADGADVTFGFINNANGFNLDIELPRERIEMINMKLGTDFYIAEQDKQLRSLAMKATGSAAANPPQVMCFDQLESALGITICEESTFVSNAGEETSVATLSSGLLRPFAVSLYMTSERKINLKGTIGMMKPGVQQWQLKYSTPGSRVNHNSALTFELGTRPAPFGRLAFDNPQMHLALEAGVTNDDREAVLYGQFEQNSDVKKSRIGFVKHGNEYRPVIEIQDKNGVTNNINGFSADGRVIVEKSGDQMARYNFDNFQIIREGGDRVVLTGWADVGQKYFKSELRVAPGQQSYFVKSNCKLEGNEISVGLFVNNEQVPENVYGGSTVLKYGEDFLDVELVGKVGTIEVELENEVHYVKSADSKSVDSTKFEHELVVKNKGKLLGKVKVSAATETDRSLILNAKVAHGDKSAEVAFNMKQNQRSQGDFVVEVNGKLNKHFVNLLAKCDVNGNRFVLDNVLTTSWGTSLTLKGEVGQRYTLHDVYIDLQGVAQFSGKEKPTQWIVKAIGAPEKTNGEFKVLRESAELIKLNGELQHPQDKVSAGKVNVIVKNVLTAKADVKIAKNGKGDLTAVVETLRTEPRHKVELSSKFLVQAPKYDVEATLTFDANKKIYIKTENIMDKLKFSTKNVLEAADKKFLFDANGSVKGDWRKNGDLIGSFVFTCPDGRVVDGSLKRKLVMNGKTFNIHGTIDTKLNDQQPGGGAKRSLVVTTKIDELKVKTMDMAGNTHVVYTDFDGKKFEVKSHIKHLPKGENKMIDFGTTVQGDFIKNPVEINFVVDEYNPKHGVYRVDGKYGQLVSVNGKGQFTLSESDKPSTYEMSLQANAPQASFKSFTLQTNGKFQKPTGPDGTQMFDMSVDQQTGDGKFVRFNTNWQETHKNGGFNMQLETSETKGPIKVDGSYENSRTSTSTGAGADTGNAITDSKGNHKHTFKFHYDDKYITSASDISYVGSESASLHYTLDTSFEGTKDIDVKVSVQKMETDSFVVKVEAKQAANVYTVDSKLYRSAHKKGFDLHATVPNNEPIVVVGTFEMLGERKAKWAVQIENLASLDLQANAEASYKAVDDFYILASWNSKKLALNQYNFEARSQGKAITFNLKNVEGVVFAGSATYALKKEQQKATIEGQGQLQYKGKTQSTNFKLIRQIYDFTIDNEIGFSYTFNGNFGPKNGVSTLKITNKEYNVKLSVCEEKKQCTNVQLQSLIATDGPDFDGKQHSLLVLIDLRELGYPYEFEFQSKTIRQGLSLQYSLDSKIVSNNNMRYQLVANVLPTASKVQLKLPSREILLETQHQYPEQGIFGHYENSAAFYFDKVNKPSDVTRLVYVADITGVPQQVINAKAEAKFEHPTIRPLSVSAKCDITRNAGAQFGVDTELVFDIFRTPEQKIVATSSVKNTNQNNVNEFHTKQAVSSVGFNMRNEFNSNFLVDGNSQELRAGAELHCIGSDTKLTGSVVARKEHVKLLFSSMDQPIVEVTGDFNRQKYISKFNTKLNIFGQQTIELSSELQPTMVKAHLKRPGLLDAHAEMKLAKEFKVSVQSKGKPIFDGRVALDAANFLQTTYTTNEDDMKAFMDTVAVEFDKDTKISNERIRQRIAKLRQIIDQQMQKTKDSVPDFSQLTASYQDSLTEIVKELENDPALKPIAETYRKLYTEFAKVAGNAMKVVAESYEKMHASIVALHEKFEVMLKDTILPIWEEFLVHTTEIVGRLRVEVVSLLTKALKSAMATLEQYGPALKNYGKAVTEAMKPFNEALQELFKVTTKASEELLTDLKEYIATLPSFEALRDELKDKLDKLKVAEHMLHAINKFFEQLHILPQTGETTAFLTKAQEYLVAKLKGEHVDDQHVIEELGKLLVQALHSVLATFKINPSTLSAAGISVEKLESFWTSMPFQTDLFSQINALLSFRFSLFNFVVNEDWDDFLTASYFKTWLSDDFGLKGHIIDGRHLVTFDGQGFSFTGTCKYILAQDSVDNNFTVVAQENNGKLKALILTDRDGNFMEVNDAGVLKLNGNVAEYPQHTPDMHAWRKYYTVWLRSEYGVEIMCTSDLKVCHINVNGFYTGKTRGLLGNGNAEPYDESVQLDGTIAADRATFINGYGLGKCNPVSLEGFNNHVDQTICEQLFGFDSTLAFGYYFIDMTPYYETCLRAVAVANEKDEEEVGCLVATAYVSALRMEELIGVLPKRCLKCAGAAGQREYNQEFTVKIPGKMADVVFVVDVDVAPAVLSQLVAPAITEIRETLKTRGFTDVHVGVIAYNESQRYPGLVTSNGGKLNYQGNFADVQLSGPSSKSFCLSCISVLDVDQKLVYVYEKLEQMIRSAVPQSDERAFKMALNYPFRAGAAKSIIGVRSNSLEFSNVLKVMRAFMSEAMIESDAAMIHLIAPVHDMSLEGVPTEKLIGFNSRLVATLDGKDAKKRQKLKFANDMGTDYVLNNGGWVFATQNFEKLQAPEQKKALNQVTNTIADTLFKTEIVSDCKCTSTYGMHAQHKCVIKSSNFIPNKKVKAASKK